MTRAVLAVVIAAIACREPEPPRTAPAARHRAAPAIDDGRLVKLLRDGDVQGA